MAYTLTRMEFDSSVEKAIDEYKKKQHAYIDEWAIPKTFEELANLLWAKLMKEETYNLCFIETFLIYSIIRIIEYSELEKCHREDYILANSLSDDEVKFLEDSVNVIIRVKNYFKSTEYFFDEMTLLSGIFSFKCFFNQYYSIQ